MTIKGTYKSINGKFSKIYGNVGVVDCHFFFQSFLDAINDNIQGLIIRKPKEYLVYKELINSFKNFLDLNGYTMCDMAYQMEGVLKDQSSYYVSDYDTIRYNVAIQANDIADALTVKTDVSINAPLESEFSTN